jgi:hypothetical protein
LEDVAIPLQSPARPETTTLSVSATSAKAGCINAARQTAPKNPARISRLFHVYDVSWKKTYREIGPRGVTILSNIHTINLADLLRLIRHTELPEPSDE